MARVGLTTLAGPALGGLAGILVAAGGVYLVFMPRDMTPGNGAPPAVEVPRGAAPSGELAAADAPARSENAAGASPGARSAGAPDALTPDALAPDALAPDALAPDAPGAMEAGPGDLAAAPRAGDAPRPDAEAGEAPPPPAVPGPATRDAPAGPGAPPDVAGAPPPVPDTASVPPDPRFDLVRAETDGSLLVAGTASPGDRIRLLVDGAEAATAMADGAGGFVLFLDLMADGEAKVLDLLAVSEDGSERRAPESVLLAPPRPESPPALAQTGPPVPRLRDGAAPPAQASDTGAPPGPGGSAPASRVQGVDTAALSAPPAGEAAVRPRSPANMQTGVQPSAIAAQSAPAGQPLPAEPSRAAASPAVPAQASDGKRLLETASPRPATEAGTASAASDSLPASIGQRAGPAPASAPRLPESSGAPPASRRADVARPDATAARARADATTDAGSARPDLRSAPSAAPRPAGGVAPPSAPAARGGAGGAAGRQAPAVLVAGAGGVRMLQPARPGAQPIDRVIVDIISYDAAGAVLLEGRSAPPPPPVDKVRVYLDNAPVDSAPIAEDGTWRLPIAGVASGVYTLRVDQLDTSGRVVSRFETPFKREDPVELARLERAGPQAASGVQASVITVQPGYTLWGIATDRYGDGFQYVQIFRANDDQIRDPDLIFPGQVFDLPDLPDPSSEN